MCLPGSFPISVSQINVELGRAANAAFDIQGATERELAGVPSGAISFSDFLGKCNTESAFVADYTVSFGGSQMTASIDVPTPVTNRRVVLAVEWSAGATPRSLSNGTIGGVSVTIHRQISITGGVGSIGVAIVSAIVPTGTTGISVVMNFSGSVGPNGHLGVWRLKGYNTIVATGADSSAPTITSLSATVATQNPGSIIGAYMGSTATNTVQITWTNATERFDIDDIDRFGGADAAGTGSNITVSASQGSIGSAGNILIVVSFGV